MTKEAADILNGYSDEFKEIEQNIYNRGVLDGMCSIRNMIQDNDKITIDQIMAAIDLILSGNTEYDVKVMRINNIERPMREEDKKKMDFSANDNLLLDILKDPEDKDEENDNIINNTMENKMKG